MEPENRESSSDSPSHDNEVEISKENTKSSPVSKVLLPEGKKRNPSYVGDPTTAVDMGNVSTMSMASNNVSPKMNVIPAQKRNIPRSIRSDQDSDVASEFQLSHSQNGDDDIVNNESSNVEENVEENDGDDADEDDEEDLHNILNDLIRHEPQALYTTASQSLAAQNVAPTSSNASTILDYNIFPYNESDSELSENSLISKYISVSKNDSNSVFHSKYKQVFVLSSAGKPIYSLNGSDGVIMGYMGLITTIVSTFEETKDHEEIKSITYDDCKIVIMNRSPLILVAITKIGYEKMQLRKAADVEADIDDQSILSRQLDTLYNYLLSMISKPMITKNFHNRMNYDLRKILTPLDFQNLDSIVMKITYGISIKEPISTEDTRNTAPDIGFGVFASELLDSALECVKLTNTTRTKLNSILLSSKKVKIPKPAEDGPSAYQTITDSIPFLKASAASDINGPTSPSATGSYGDDLLFAILLDANCKIMSAMKPKHHNLKNEDLKILLTLISNQQHLTRHTKSEEGILDLWIPICMPHFNCNGFLYAFVKTIFVKPEDLRKTSSPGIPTTIVLLSSSKNSFFHMQEVSKQIEFRINQKMPSFTSTLYQELSTTTISIFRDIHVPQIKHFIYKSRSSNQFVSSDIEEFSRGNGTTTMNILKLVYFYSTLHNTRATPIRNTDSSSSSGGSTGNGASNGNLLPAKSASESNGSSSNSTSTGRNKKLTYIKNFGRNGENIICFMLCSDKYEFYCLCDDRTITTQFLINHSLKIIKWCEKNRKRLFIDAGAVF
ncbi:putative vacuolar fusion protein Mon1p [[Candida] railenensis]|uniref:Vacuolar fusion protein MON1 n=1 Tax=[Candida] railenensis TaxID=45579 RepID=A0A9P0QKZ7_9ASCO|nr:putative vacuolar fusion protein Mon1p [[Candida] railenensis]